MEDVNLFTYANTLGSVNRETSKTRTTREEATKRAQHILDLLNPEATKGFTWKELAQITGLHHGQISGLLSNMHRAGLVAQLRAKRDGCHPYIHADYVAWCGDGEVFIEPVSTQAGRTRTRLNLLMDALEQCSRENWSNPDTVWALRITYEEIKKDLANEDNR